MQTKIDQLAQSIASSPIAMAVVDYAGRYDGDGLVTEDSPRRYGVRDLRHVAIYGLTALRFNAAARDRGLAR